MIARTRPSKSVLVVDDNAAIRRAVSQLFFSDDFSVCGEATNGREAIEFVKQLTPDLIILDLSMPVMTGLQAAPELRKIAPNTSIILLTLFASEIASPENLPVDLVLSKATPLATVKDMAFELLARRVQHDVVPGDIYG